MLRILAKFSKRVAFARAVANLIRTVGSEPDWDDAICEIEKAEADGKIHVTEWSKIGSQLGLYNKENLDK